MDAYSQTVRPAQTRGAWMTGDDSRFLAPHPLPLTEVSIGNASFKGKGE